MAVDTLTCFPDSIVAGNTVRVNVTEPDYPSSEWTLVVSLANGSVVKSFAAQAGTNNSFDIVLTAANTATLTPAGEWQATFVYTEIATTERATVDMGETQVLPDPTVAATPTQAQTTLAAMQDALESLSSGQHQSVSFNGQQFTKRNISELMDAIGRQQQIVNREQARIDQALGRSRNNNLYTLFGRR